jgi:hypothetical protein
MVCSRESVPLPGYVSPYVLLVSNLYRKLVLLFWIYTILTFDKKKKKLLSKKKILVVAAARERI